MFHIAPNWAMRADALAQYLLWKKWRHWVLIVGKSPADQGYAAAIRRAANRFGAKIVEERPYAFDAGQRRTDTGHQQIQTQMPMLTQGAPDHDVVIVADESEVFGDYLLFRTAEPRPVAGTQGLVAVAWHRSFEEYAGTQMQNRFEKQDGAHHDRARLHRVARRAHLRRGGDAHRRRTAPMRCAPTSCPTSSRSPASRARA